MPKSLLANSLYSALAVPGDVGEVVGRGVAVGRVGAIVGLGVAVGDDVGAGVAVTVGTGLAVGADR
jgi:hypothetical protein